MIIGKKDSFGIELNEIKANKGKLLIWFNGEAFGCFNEEEYLKKILSSLRKATSEKKYLNPQDIDQSKLFEMFLDDKIGRFDSLIFSPGESFDDFIIRIFHNDNRLFFCCKLVENPYFEYPNLKKIVYCETIDLETYNAVLDKFESVINADS